MYNEENYDKLMAEVRGKIPKREYESIMGQVFCELDSSFLGFLEDYEDAKRYIPERMPIIDLGCYLAAQAYMFSQEYIGVNEELCINRHYPPLRRFSPENATHYDCRIEHFHIIFDKPFENYFAIMNAVPDWNGELKEHVIKTYPNCYISYPGKRKYVQIGWKQISDTDNDD